ncbi:MAG TPA: pilus assembly protein PilM [Candidatus Omnitrophota bacterium]|nr:pilus assembly protein PilM [Candidatus Omnitrophota bacterium]HPS37515.1 pilus assembly protein PilM [Candidatus Omnitrophota bacterium]
MTSDSGSIPKSKKMPQALSGLAGLLFSAQKNDGKVTVCDLGRFKTLLVEVRKYPDHLYISRFELLKNAFHDQKPALALKPFFDGKRFRKEGIRVTLKGHGVVIRFIRFPKMKLEDLGSAMKYEAEQYIPFELNNVAIDFAVVDENIRTDDGEKMEVMLSVIKLPDLEPTLEIFRNLECRLAVVDVDILAALAALEYFHPEDFKGHVGLLDLGSEISTLGIVRDGNPRFIRDISYGTYDLQKRLKTRSNFTEEMTEKILESDREPPAEAVEAIRESLDGLIGDLRVSFDYYQDQSARGQPLEKLFLSGGAAANPVVLRSLSEGLKIPVVCMDILKKIKWAPEIDEALVKSSLPLLPVVLGLGVRDE